MSRTKLRLGTQAGRVALPSLMTIALTLAACSGSVHRRAEPRLTMQGSGTPVAAVFSDPGRPELAEIGSEESRRDGLLSPRIAGAITASDQWPEPDRPSPRYLRRLHFNSSPDTFLYFERGSDHIRHLHGGHPRSW